MIRIKSVFNLIRLSLFSIIFGVLGAFMGGTLNRLMVAELGLPVTLVALLFAIPLITSPLRVWLGYYSDSHPLFGKRREPYLLIGSALAAAGIIGVAYTIAHALTLGSVMLVALFLVFVVYGFGRNLAHNIFQAVLAERLSGDQKRFITLFEVATLIGAVMGAGAVGRALETFDPARLISVAWAIGVLLFVLSAIAIFRQENPANTAAARQAGAKPFGKTVRDVVLADPQARLFFLLVLFTFIGTLAQDILLEPYGALVLNMSVGDTTRLTAFWGVGVLISMLISGTVLIKWLGYKRVLRAGLILSMLTFIGLIALGMSGRAEMFRSLVLVMGLGAGLAGAGMLTGVMAFTTPVRAGMLMGVWGMANLLGRAAGSIMGGVVVDGVQAVTGSALTAYSTVFLLEAVMLVIAFVLSYKLHIEDALAQKELAGFPEPRPAVSV
jgi:BCD family chlorophyll transporter-like MFS transporter